jgi:hypothetical protein
MPHHNRSSFWHLLVTDFRTTSAAKKLLSVLTVVLAASFILTLSTHWGAPTSLGAALLTASGMGLLGYALFLIRQSNRALNRERKHQQFVAAERRAGVDPITAEERWISDTMHRRPTPITFVTVAKRLGRYLLVAMIAAIATFALFAALLAIG